MVKTGREELKIPSFALGKNHWWPFQCQAETLVELQQTGCSVPVHILCCSRRGWWITLVKNRLTRKTQPNHRAAVDSETATIPRSLRLGLSPHLKNAFKDLWRARRESPGAPFKPLLRGRTCKYRTLQQEFRINILLSLINKLTMTLRPAPRDEQVPTSGKRFHAVGAEHPFLLNTASIKEPF